MHNSPNGWPLNQQLVAHQRSLSGRLPSQLLLKQLKQTRRLLTHGSREDRINSLYARR